jgi:hypothetical protein
MDFGREPKQVRKNMPNLLAEQEYYTKDVSVLLDNIEKLLLGGEVIFSDEFFMNLSI